MTGRTSKGLGLLVLFFCLTLPACDGGTKETIAQLEQEVNQWRAKYESLAESTDELQEEINELQAEKDELQEKAGRVEGLTEGLDEKSNRVEELEQSVSDLQAQVENLKEAGQASPLPVERVRDRLTVLGADLFQLGNYNAALPVLASAHDLGKNAPDLLYRMAYCQAEFGETRQAADYYRQCYEALQKQEQPDAALLTKCLSNWGVVLAASGQFEKAVEKYTEAIQADETFAPAYFNLGLIYADKLQQPEKAVEAFRKHVAHGGDRLVSAKRQIESLLADMPEESE